MDHVNAEFTVSSSEEQWILEAPSQSLLHRHGRCGVFTYFSISYGIKSTYLLLHGPWINKSHQVGGKVTNHIFHFTSISNLKAQRTENLGIQWGLRHGGPRGDEGTFGMKLVPCWQHSDFSIGFYQHVHCQVGDALWRWVCFDHASWGEKHGVGERTSSHGQCPLEWGERAQALAEGLRLRACICHVLWDFEQVVSILWTSFPSFLKWAS